jgi:hypothetical protein
MSELMTRPNEMDSSSPHRSGIRRPRKPPEEIGIPLRASEGNVRTPHCVPMRCQNWPLQPGSNRWSSSHRTEMPQNLCRNGGGADSPQSIEMKCRNPSLRPNDGARLLTGPEWNGMLLIASERNVTTPHRLGRKRDAPQSIGMKCRNPSLRPSEMSELLTAPEWSGMLLVASERNVTTPHRLGMKWDAPSEHRNELLEPPTASQ